MVYVISLNTAPKMHLAILAHNNGGIVCGVVLGIGNGTSIMSSRICGNINIRGMANKHLCEYNVKSPHLSSWERRLSRILAPRTGIGRKLTENEAAWAKMGAVDYSAGACAALLGEVNDRSYIAWYFRVALFALARHRQAGPSCVASACHLK